MKFADLNFAWADAREMVAVKATKKAAARAVAKTVLMECDIAPSATLTAQESVAKKLAAKTPVVKKNIDPRWVDVLSGIETGLTAEQAVESVKIARAEATAKAKAVKVKAAASLVAPSVKKEVAVIALPKAPAEVAIKKAANTPEVKARLKAAKAARKAEAVKAKKAAVKAMKLEKVRAKAAVAEGINKEAIEAVVGTEVAQAAINAEFARLINSIKTLQARTYVFNGKDKVSYTDTRTGVTSYYAIEWKAHEVVSFKAQG